MTWADAAEVAALAMGVEKERDGKRFRTVKRASKDPLAWWCLTELIMQRATVATTLDPPRRKGAKR